MVRSAIQRPTSNEEEFCYLLKAHPSFYANTPYNKVSAQLQLHCTSLDLLAIVPIFLHKSSQLRAHIKLEYLLEDDTSAALLMDGHFDVARVDVHHIEDEPMDLVAIFRQLNLPNLHASVIVIFECHHGFLGQYREL
ncbi:MAG: hypothetical protein A0129_10405 [Limnobacter sp. CACIAM 66H1]|nr:MAG: hypothetical protein A0129_10405 [Limnobacter sp. CACIAM 66H1]